MSSQIIRKALQFTHLLYYANEVAGLSDSETSEDMYGSILTLRTKLKIWLLEDLFEEMNDKAGQSNGSYFPFPSKIFALCTCW